MKPIKFFKTIEGACGSAVTESTPIEDVRRRRVSARLALWWGLMLIAATSLFTAPVMAQEIPVCVTDRENVFVRSPNVIGMPLADAQRELEDDHLDSVTDPSAAPAGVEAGLVYVIGQAVHHQYLAPDVTLCLGTIVPPLDDLSYTDAEVVVAERGLTFEALNAPGEGWLVEQGSVSPAPGSPVDFGETIEAAFIDPTPPVIDPPAEEVVVPDLLGRRLRVARRSVVALGLVLKRSGTTRGGVVRQDPPAGTTVPPGTPVTVTIRRAVLTAGGDRQTPTLLLVAVLIAAAVGTTALLWRRHQRKFVRKRVRAAARHGDSAIRLIRDSGAPDTALRLELHSDLRIGTLEEVHR